MLYYDDLNISDPRYLRQFTNQGEGKPPRPHPLRFRKQLYKSLPCHFLKKIRDFDHFTVISK